MTLKSPFSPQNILHQGFASAAGLSVGSVIGAHHCFHTGLLYQLFKGRKVCFIQILPGNFCIKAVAHRLRSRMNRKMLCTGRSRHIFPISLQPLYKRFSQLPGQIGILPVGLMSPAPPGIPENIHIGRPEGQSLINVPVLQCTAGIIFRPSLHRYNPAHLLHKLPMEGGSHADGLRKAGSSPGSGHTMEPLIPPVISRYIQSGNGRCIIPELGSLFLQRHSADQLLRPISCLLPVSHSMSSTRHILLSCILMIPVPDAEDAHRLDVYVQLCPHIIARPP